MRHKHFFVVTYVISDTKRRDKVVKIMETIGSRVNYSVFECMLTDKQYERMRNQLVKVIHCREDRINIYPICTECYARIQYMPELKTKLPDKIVVI